MTTTPPAATFQSTPTQHDDNVPDPVHRAGHWDQSEVQQITTQKLRQIMMRQREKGRRSGVLDTCRGLGFATLDDLARFVSAHADCEDTR